MLIVGVGSSTRGDDAAGLRAIHRLQTRLPPDIHTLIVDNDPASLVEAWRGHRHVIVIDAMSSGDLPGAVRRFDASTDPLPPGFAITSTHEFGPGQAIELARSLGTLPKRVIFYGIEGKDFEAGSELSAAAKRGVAEVVGRVLTEALEADLDEADPFARDPATSARSVSG